MLAALALAASLLPGALDGLGDYLQCAKASAARLEPSGETAPVVADAALEDCMGKLNGAKLAYLVVGQGHVSEEAAERSAKSAGHSAAVLMVVQMRALKVSRPVAGSRTRP